MSQSAGASGSHVYKRKVEQPLCFIGHKSMHAECARGGGVCVCVFCYIRLRRAQCKCWLHLQPHRRQQTTNLKTFDARRILKSFKRGWYIDAEHLFLRTAMLPQRGDRGVSITAQFVSKNERILIMATPT